MQLKNFRRTSDLDTLNELSHRASDRVCPNHIKKGQPTFVVVWREDRGKIRFVEEVHTKKHPTEDMITLQLRVHRHNAPLVKRYAEIIESEEERTYTVAEVFPEYIGKESQVALRAYRTREALTQKQLSELTGIPQHHISEMETGKRSIGKERAKKLAEALHCDYRQLL